jgi:hypothetical protein
MTKNLTLALTLLLISIIASLTLFVINYSQLKTGFIIFNVVNIIIEIISLYFIYKRLKIGFYMYFGVCILSFLLATMNLVNPLHLIFQAIIVILLSKVYRREF